jgi:hypothetical protein
MAIKGKSKSRGSKTVTGGPKPVYVPVKTPLLRRRGLWIGVGAIVGVALVLGVVYGLMQERNRDRDEALSERMTEAMKDYQGQIEPILTAIGSAAPPSGFNAFPGLGATIDTLAVPEVDEQTLVAAASDAESSAERARSAAGLFEEIVPTDLVADKGFPQDFNLYVINSRDGFVRSMHLFRQAALLLSMAVEAEPGDPRVELAARAKDVYDLGVQTFNAAHDDYVQAQVQAKVFESAPVAPGASLFTGPTG